MNTIAWSIALCALVYNDCKMREMGDLSESGKIIHTWMCVGCLIMMMVCTFV